MSKWKDNVYATCTLRILFCEEYCVYFRKQFDLHQSLLLNQTDVRIKEWGQKRPCDGSEMENLPLQPYHNSSHHSSTERWLKALLPSRISELGFLWNDQLSSAVSHEGQHSNIDLNKRWGIVAILSHLILVLCQERNSLLSPAMLICVLYAWSQVAPSLSYKS